MIQEKGENKMPKGKGTYGKQVGRPPEDGSKRSVKTYAGGGLTGYNVPQPQGTEWGQMRQFRMEEGGKITFKTSTGQVNEYPDTEKGRSIMEEDKITDSIKAKREAKAKKEVASKAKKEKAAKKAKSDKEREKRRNLAKKEGLKTTGVMPGGSGRE